MVIYKITNKINCKIYIGQTNDPKRRYKQHFLEKNSNDSLIKKSIKKYGKENFIFEIIFSSEDINEINLKEEYYIKKFETTNREKGYNIKNGGNNHFHAEETKIKISNSQLGEKNHMYNKKGKDNKTSKKVIELKTNTIFDSVTSASEILNLNLSHIASVCRGKRNSTGGYIFRYLNENQEIIENERPQKNKSRRIKNLITNKIYNSFKEIEEDLNIKIDSGNIIKNINGKNKTSYGYKWTYID